MCRSQVLTLVLLLIYAPANVGRAVVMGSGDKAEGGDGNTLSVMTYVPR
jgi:hypothetical protein